MVAWAVGGSGKKKKNWVQVTWKDLERGQHQKILAPEHLHKIVFPETNCITMQFSRFRSAECDAVYHVKIQTQKPWQKNWSLELGYKVWILEVEKKVSTGYDAESPPSWTKDPSVSSAQV